VRGAGDRSREGEEDFPIANRGFDTTPMASATRALVLGEGEYLLDVRCGDRAFRSRFGWPVRTAWRNRSRSSFAPNADRARGRIA
jgi:hypothetical protein